MTQHPPLTEDQRQRAQELTEALGLLTAPEQLPELAERLAGLARPRQPLQALEDLRALLELLEHPLVARYMRRADLPGPLHRAALEALGQLMPALGVRAVGSLRSAARQARERLDAERRKVDMIFERLDGVDPARLEQMLEGYVSTDPAPVFLRRMERACPEVLERARARWNERLDPSGDPERQELIELARDSPPLADPERARALLRQLDGRTDRSAARAAEVLRAGRGGGVVLGAMLAGWRGQRQLAHPILEALLRGPPDAEVLAVIAGHLHPLMARQVLSVLLAEASWGNPEEPEYELTGGRARAVISARCLLPRLGSPLPALEPGASLPERMRGEGLEALPRRIDALWAQWAEVREASPQ